MKAKSHKLWSRTVGAQRLVWALTLCNTPGVRGERGLEVHRLMVTPVGCQLSGAAAVSSVLLHFWHVCFICLADRDQELLLEALS